jgi:ABC-2 type transport system ATP-binding protein
VLQSTGVERYLTASEIVALYGGYYPGPRPAAELLELVGLSAQAGTRVGRLSGGQRRRLDLAIALVGRPELVFLDEPTTGFDPSARRSAWEIVRNLASEGTTVLLTTHFMDEAQALADRLAVLVDGRIVAEGTPQEVVGRTSSDTIVHIRLPDDRELPAELGLAPDPAGPGRYVARTPEPTAFLHRLTGWAVAQGVAFHELEVARPSLEDTYLALTGRPPEPDEPPRDEGPGRRRRRGP